MSKERGENLKRVFEEVEGKRHEKTQAPTQVPSQPQQPAQQPQQAQSRSETPQSLEDVQIPVERVTVPSRGRVYPVDHPLANQESTEIVCMSAFHEDLLTSRALIKNRNCS